MQTREEVNDLLKRFIGNMPRKMMTKIERTNIGIGMVLRYLEEVGRPVSAGEISRFMNVSTARVAVILRTMSEKGLIVRSVDCSDARKVCIGLSETGQKSYRMMTDELIGLMAEIVERIGMERMELFLQIASEINAVVTAKITEKEE